MKAAKKQILIAIISGISVLTISAAGKSYIDVVRIKTKMELFIDTIHEIKDDVKEIKLFLIRKGK
jgi:hypothetical protein